jgi:hypothetical protein
VNIPIAKAVFGCAIIQFSNVIRLDEITLINLSISIFMTGILLIFKMEGTY